MLISKLNRFGKQTLVIQLGSGLIGSAIARLISDCAIPIENYKVNWTETSQTKSWLKALDLSSYQFESAEIIWAAGKAGFRATEEEIKVEIDNFNLITEALRAVTQGLSTRFWLMSSAGGLHEGQTCVGDLTAINPSRPYAHLKLQQENLIKELYDQYVLCRISSVYTTQNLSGRMGLIPVLMKNGIQNKVSTLVGSESTLRDYVLDTDIGNYVVKHILNGSNLQGTQYLVNGAPVSIRTIKGQIEQIILKKLYIKYAPVRQNSANISFLKSTKSDTFNSTPLLSNIKILYNSILSYS